MTDHSDDPRGGESASPPLPPPAFPPGSRRSSSRRFRSASPASGGGDEFPSDAFISPDEPIIRTEFPEEAMISPDDPIEHRDPVAVAVADEEPEDGPDDGIVTGMGVESMYTRGSGPVGAVREEALMELTERLDALAAQIREDGIAALAVRSETHHFDAVLRSVVAGYIAGRR